MVHNQPIIYLNNAATSWPKPREVMAAVNESLSLPVFGSFQEGTTDLSVLKQREQAIGERVRKHLHGI